MSAIESRIGKKVQESWFTDCIESLTKNASQEGFYKASQEIAPMIVDLPKDTVIEIDFSFGTYSTDVAHLEATVTKVIETREANANHYSAIEKANKILSTIETFTLDGVKPDNKRGAPRKERKLNL